LAFDLEFSSSSGVCLGVIFDIRGLMVSLLHDGNIVTILSFCLLPDVAF